MRGLALPTDVSWQTALVAMACRRPSSYDLLRVTSVVVHPNFTSSSSGAPLHNLALLLLQSPSSKPPVALPGGKRLSAV